MPDQNSKIIIKSNCRNREAIWRLQTINHIANHQDYNGIMSSKIVERIFDIGWKASSRASIFAWEKCIVGGINSTERKTIEKSE